jgi:hypothetical protein
MDLAKAFSTTSGSNTLLNLHQPMNEEKPVVMKTSPLPNTSSSIITTSSSGINNTSIAMDLMNSIGKNHISQQMTKKAEDIVVDNPYGSLIPLRYQVY